MTPFRSSDPSQPLIIMDQVVRDIDGDRHKKRALNQVSWSLHPGQRIAVVTFNRAEADAFLSCACGVSPVQAGKVTINTHVSWPIGETEAMLGRLSARQNAEFLQRIYGIPRQYQEEMETIRALCDFESGFFEMPLRSYNNEMKARFRLAVSLVFEFEVFAVLRLAAWTFSSNSSSSQRFRAAFEEITEGKSLIVTHPDFHFQNTYCQSGLVLFDGAIVCEGDLATCHEWVKAHKKRHKP
jgi:capsular polysaccharide transport system ATP-binding protein